MPAGALSGLLLLLPGNFYLYFNMSYMTFHFIIKFNSINLEHNSNHKETIIKKKKNSLRNSVA